VSREDLARLIETLEEHGGLQRAIISSPHEQMLSEVARLRPELRRALLLFRGVRVAADAARRAAYLGCAAVNPNYTLVDAELVSICHKHSMKVFAFTVNERGTMQTLESMGVDGFFTDYPDRVGRRAS
jgi:glycerophosphoryl diester phosphodiesterase